MAEKQRAMFRPSADGRSAQLAPVEIWPHFADPEDAPRLTKQNAAILAILRLGPASNTELVAIALNYRARISEVREWLEHNTGETIRCIRGKGGLNWYKIVELTSDTRDSRPDPRDRAGNDSPLAARPGRSPKDQQA